MPTQTASSAAALGHLGAADKRGSGAKTARNRCTECFQQPNHGVGPSLRLLLQSLLTSFLDLPDLADDKAQPRHIGAVRL
jgi:hypothetical protein